jgi:uncharacterized protein (TIGR02271 family)
MEGEERRGAVEPGLTSDQPGGQVESRSMTGDDLSLPLQQEELTVRKEQLATGELVLGKRVLTEHRILDLPVSRDEIELIREPVQARPASLEFGAGEVRVPIFEDQVHVEKAPVVSEEVRVAKRPVEEVKHVAETLRREEPVIERSDGFSDSGATDR